MRRRFAWLGAVLVLAVAAGVGYAVWRISPSSQSQVCQVCSRPIHGHTRTVALVGNRRRLFCCPACALTAHDQNGRPVRIVELTDYESHAPLVPDRAYVLRGSDVNPCVQMHAPLDQAKQPTAVEFDRCSPSMLAFAAREAALRFAGEHGGEVMPYSALAAAYTR